MLWGWYWWCHGGVGDVVGERGGGVLRSKMEMKFGQ